jgi:hypothetical protein
MDPLHVMSWTEGAYWLTDPGLPVYDRSAVTMLMRGSPARNLVLMDERAHVPEPFLRHVERPMPLAVMQEGPLLAAAAKRELLSNLVYGRFRRRPS